MNNSVEEYQKMLKSGVQLERKPFMQQLSINGSVLMTKNHDQRWMLELGHILECEYWSQAQRYLLAMDGKTARRVLWRASYRWWKQSINAMSLLAETCWNINEELPEIYWQYFIQLEKTALMLDGLKWCETQEKSIPFTIVDINHNIVTHNNSQQAGVLVDSL